MSAKNVCASYGLPNKSLCACSPKPGMNFNAAMGMWFSSSIFKMNCCKKELPCCEVAPTGEMACCSKGCGVSCVAVVASRWYERSLSSTPILLDLPHSCQDTINIGD